MLPYIAYMDPSWILWDLLDPQRLGNLGNLVTRFFGDTRVSTSTGKDDTRPILPSPRPLNHRFPGVVKHTWERWPKKTGFAPLKEFF